MTEHISIQDAISAGITKLRMDNWADPADHIEIYITECNGEKLSGPWVKFWSPTLERVGMKNPQEIIITEFNTNDKCWGPYKQKEG